MVNNSVDIKPFDIDQCRGHMRRHISSTEVTIEGRLTIPGRSPGSTVSYLAAAPPDFRSSFSGSGLPFTSPAMALENTPNKGTAPLNPTDQTFQITIQMPNSYYAGHGTVLVPPTLYITYTLPTGKPHTVAVQIDEPIPYRTLTYPNNRTSAMFYDVPLPVRSQEQILLDSAYPQESTLMPQNHWGFKPPL